MQSDNKVFHHESLQDKKNIRQLLEAVTNGLEKGELSFSNDRDDIIMQPEGLLHLKLSASMEDGRNRVSIRITWHDDLDNKPSKNSLSINKKHNEKKKS